MNDDHDPEYRPVSFIARFQVVDEETPQKRSPPTFSAQTYYFYVLLFSFSEYILLFLLRNYYFAAPQPAKPTPNPTPGPNDNTSPEDIEIEYTNTWDAEVIKYFFFRLLSMGVMLYRNQSLVLKVRYVFRRLFTSYSGTLFVVYGVVIWLGVLSVLNAFLLTNVVLLVYSQSYYKLLAHVVKGYPLKKLDYRFLGAFSLFIILFFIYKLEKFMDVALLIVCGYFFYTREEVARVHLDYEEVEILSYFTKAAILLLFVVKFFVNITYDSFPLSFKDALVGALVCAMDYFRVLCYKNVSEATAEIEGSHYRDTNVLILVCVAFGFDVVVITGEYGFWHYLFSLVGIGALGYYNKAFLQQVAAFKAGRREKVSDLEVELKEGS